MLNGDHSQMLGKVKELGAPPHTHLGIKDNLALSELG